MSAAEKASPKATGIVSRAPQLIWVPSLLVGVAAAIAMATGAAVLLYDYRGLPRAAVALAVITILSLIAGLRAGASEGCDEALPPVGRWWLGLLVTLLGGAGFTALWETTRGLGGVLVAQGVGLAVAVALPTYFAGGVWGCIAGFAGSLGSGARRQVAAGAVFGTLGGAALVVALLGRSVLAVTAFLAAMVFASGGARVQGWIFDRVPRRSEARRESGRAGRDGEPGRTAVPERDRSSAAGRKPASGAGGS